MRRVGGELIQRGIDRQPQPPAAIFDVHLGPRVVVERAVDVDESHRDARGNAGGARHRDIQRGVLVAVADFRPQHLARRRQADGRFLV